MADKPTPADAELILKLYDLRRETELRKARHWWIATFSPQSADDAMKVGMAMGSQENNWLRQVVGYWEMASSLVLHGALNEELFLEGSFSGEMFVVFGKIQPFLKELREKMQNPNAFRNMEKVIMNAKGGPERLKQTQERMVMFRRMAETAKAS